MPSATRRFLQRLRLWHGGPVVLLIGTGLVAAGLLQTTTATQTVACPAGTVLIAKFNFDHNRYEFEKPDGNENVVRISNGSENGGDWRSTIAVSAIVVKGGPAAVVTWFDPPQTAGQFSGGNLPDVASGHTPDISNVQFCGQGSSGTTTTAPTTTTPTTTTAPTTTTPTTTTAPTTTVSYVTSTSVVVLSAGAQAPEGTSLPRTGAPSIPMLVLGIVFMAMGATLTIVGGARDRRRI